MACVSRHFRTPGNSLIASSFLIRPSYTPHVTHAETGQEDKLSVPLSDFLAFYMFASQDSRQRRLLARSIITRTSLNTKMTSFSETERLDQGCEPSYCITRNDTGEGRRFDLSGRAQLKVAPHRTTVSTIISAEPPEGAVRLT